MRGRRVLPKLGQPLAGAEAAYALELRAIARRASNEIMAVVWPWLRAYEAGQRQDAAGDRPPRVPKPRAARARTAARKQAKRVEQDGRAAADRQIAAAVGGHWKWPEPGVRQRASQAAFIERNVALIESIPQQLHAQVVEVLTAAHERGALARTIRRELQERFAVAESRADLIARDQTLKLGAQLSQDRAREQGSKGYTWRISGSPRKDGDGRVRPMHRALEGTKHDWDDPPVTNEAGDENHPGEDYGCRCNAETDARELLESLLAE